jgi:hypothetical protein
VRKKNDLHTLYGYIGGPIRRNAPWLIDALQNHTPYGIIALNSADHIGKTGDRPQLKTNNPLN